MRRRLRGLAACLLLLMGCTAQRPSASPAAEETLFTGTLQELAPHHDGDHFVYRALGAGPDERLQVEHVSALDRAGEFVVNVTEDGAAIGKVHLREEGQTIAVISEGSPSEDLMFVYAEPLPGFSVPLRSGPSHASSPVSVLRVSDGEVLAHGRAEQRVTARRVTAETGPEQFEVRTERSMQLPDRAMALTATVWVTPGIGEVRSEGRTNDGPALRRELVCAIIAGHRVGDCAALLLHGTGR